MLETTIGSVLLPLWSLAPTDEGFARPNVGARADHLNSRSSAVDEYYMGKQKMSFK